MASGSFAERLTPVDSWLLEQLRRLERISTRLGAELSIFDKLKEINKAIADALGSDMSSVLLVSESGNELTLGASIGLTDEYAEALSRIPIGPDVGACGSSAYSNQVVIVEDARTDPRCASFVHATEQAGLRGLWSVPISTPSGKVLGTFASYYKKPYRPQPQEIVLAQACARHAAVSIENSMLYASALRSERRYRLLMENASDGIGLFDANGYCEIGNSAVHKMLGYQVGEIENRNIKDIIHPEDLSREPVPYCDLDAGATTRKERRLKCKDGSYLPVEVTSRRVADNTYLAIVRDISARRRSEQARVAIYKLASELVKTNSLEQIYEQSLNALHDAIGVDRASISLADANGSIKFKAFRGVSDSYRKRIESSPWLPASSEFIFVSDVSTSPLTKRYAKALEREGIKAVAAVPLIYDSSLLGRLVLYYPEPHEFSDEERHVAQTIASHVSLAIVRKRSEDAIATSEREYRGLFEQAHDAIIVLDPETGAVLDVNNRACSLYRINRIEFLERSLSVEGSSVGFTSTKQTATDELAELGQRALIEDPGAPPLEVRHLANDGQELSLEVNVSLVTYSGQRALLLINRDVTERRRAEAALHESEERFSKAFDASPNPMAIASLRDARYIAVNDRLIQLLGYTRDEIIGHTPEDLNTWVDPIFRTEAINLFIQSGSVRDMEARYRTRSGEIRTALISVDVIEVSGEKCLLIAGTDITDRKQAEDERNESRKIELHARRLQWASEARFSKVFNSNPNPMWLFNRQNHHCIDANDSALRLGRYKKEEVIGRPPGEIPAWEGLGELLEEFAQRAGDSHGQAEGHLRTGDGRDLSLLLAAESFDLRQDRCFLVAGTDITDLKAAEQERDTLLASERLARSRAEHAWGLTNELLAREQTARTEVQFAHRELQTTLDTMADLVTVVGKDDRLIRANRSFYERLGLEPEMCEGRLMTELMHPPGDKFEGISCPLCELRHRAKRGAIEVPPGIISDYPFFASVDPIVNAQGETVAIIQSVRDLSDLYEARADADRERTSLNAAIEQMPDGLVVFDRAARVVRANRHAERLFGFTRDEMVADADFGLREGKFFDEAGRDVPTDRLPVNRALRSRQTVDCRGWYHGPTGDRLLLSVTVSPLFDPTGTMVGAIGLFRDITRQQRQHERDLQAEKLRALGQLASGVAHNLNNSLAAVLGYTQLAQPKVNNPDVERYLHVVEKSAKDAARMVERIQNFARARASKHEFISLRILDVVRDAVEITKPRWRNDAETRSIRYDVKLRPSPDADCLIDGEPSELREVFVNIILNALDAMPTGGQVRIDASGNPREVKLSFTDTGAGMSEEIKQRIFEPFFSTKGVSGLGMGLSESYRIIERHGGRIDVESNIAVGTSFHITLPLVAKPETNGDSSHALTAMARKRIMVIDDEEFVRSLLSTMLTGWGHVVLMASSAEEGLSLLESHHVDVVFIDLAMPSIDGISAAADIKSKWPDVRIILMTGYGADTARELSSHENPVDFAISKPFTMPDLHKALLEIIGTQK